MQVAHTTKVATITTTISVHRVVWSCLTTDTCELQGEDAKRENFRKLSVLPDFRALTIKGDIEIAIAFAAQSRNILERSRSGRTDSFRTIDASDCLSGDNGAFTL